MKKKQHLLIPYITAGFPTKKLFLPILKTLSKYNADYIEVGVPHSDPLADGLVIQKASKIALDKNVTLSWIVETLRATSLQKLIKPLILFSYFNPILNYGLKRLLKDLPKPLFYGLIIPDLPLEEAKKYLPIFKRYKLKLILLIAPTTKKDRMIEITKRSHSLIYLVSRTGVTGERKTLSSELKYKIKEIKANTKKPVVVGFGISTPNQASKVISYGADGFVVGSALIKKLSVSKVKKPLVELSNFVSRFSKI